MHVERLTKLAELLETAKEDGTIEVDGGDCIGEKQIRFRLHSWLNPTLNCGTAACAVGAAGLTKWFQKEGLSINNNSFNSQLIPYYGDDRGWDAVNLFFDIDDVVSTYLFETDSYSRATPKMVADRIRELLQNPKSVAEAATAHVIGKDL